MKLEWWGIALVAGFVVALLWRRAVLLRALHAARVEMASFHEQLRIREHAASTAEGQLAQAQDKLLSVTGEVGSLRAVAERVEEFKVAVARREEEVETLRQALTGEQTQRTRSAMQLEAVRGELLAQREHLREKAAEAEKSRALLKTELEHSATMLVEEKGGALLGASQKQFAALIEPLQARLTTFEQKVEKTYDLNNRDRASLIEHLEHLQKAQVLLHTEAQGLARALTGDAKAQGNWGELTLHRVLEMAQLTEGLNYELQVSERDEEGVQRRPDVILRLPKARAVIIDSKVSLKAFVEYTNTTQASERRAALKMHGASVRKHVRELAGKAYQTLLKQQTLDSVLMFIPSEPAFHAAIAEDAQLYDFALSQRIFIVSPTTLLPALQLIAQLWRNERQTHNAQRIAQDAGRMLDKLHAFLRDLDAVGKCLSDAHMRYDEARKKLATGKGNVLRRAQHLVALGAQVRPETARALQALPVDEGDVLESKALENNGEEAESFEGRSL